MKVAYLGNSRSPHNLRWVTYLAEHFDLIVYSFEDEAIPGVPTVVLPRPTGTKLDYFLMRRRVARLVAEQAPDLIHAHRITSYGYLGAQVARRLTRAGADPRPKRVPFLLSVWGEDIFSFPKKSRFHRRFTRRVLSSADQILSTSNIMARETEKYVRPARPITVTPFGVDTELFAPAGESGADSGAEAGATGRSATVTVGTVKKLRKRYGVDVLIRAFARARGRVPELRLEIVGEGPERENLERLARELGVAEVVTFRGRVAHGEVPAVLRSFDLFAALSVTDDESFGVAMIEASAVGLPVLATRVGGIPEVVLDGETGFLVPRRDVAGAAERLAELAADRELRRRMGEAGRRFVEEHYSWKVTADRMRRIYLKVAGGPAGDRSTPIFVLGSARNGTTWLSNTIARHSGVAAVQHQAHWGFHESNLYKNQRYFGSFETTDDLIRCVELYGSGDHFRLAGGETSRVYAERPGDFYDLFFNLMDRFAETEEKPFWLTKLDPLFYQHPRELRRFLSRLTERYGEATFVAIKRRLPEVIRSYLNMEGRAHQRRTAPGIAQLLMVFETARYLVHYRRIRGILRAHGGRTIRYEELAGDPRPALKRVLEPTGLEFEEGMLEARYTPNSSVAFRGAAVRNLSRPEGWILQSIVRPLLVALWPVTLLLLRLRERSKPKVPPVYFKLLKLESMPERYREELAAADERGLLSVLFGDGQQRKDET